MSAHGLARDKAQGRARSRYAPYRMRNSRDPFELDAKYTGRTVLLLALSASQVQMQLFVQYPPRVSSWPGLPPNRKGADNPPCSAW